MKPPTHIVTATYKDPATGETRDCREVCQDEHEAAQAYARHLETPGLYCAAIARIETSTDWS